MSVASAPKASFRPALRPTRPVSVARLRSLARQISSLVLLAFVLSHFASHIFLIVSVPLADAASTILMALWWTPAGGVLLALATAVHVLNALWSVYLRRSLRMSRWEWAQLALGLSIPPLLILHVVGTRIADLFLGTDSSYVSVLTVYWVSAPGLKLLQIAAVLAVWVHACIGMHFWLRVKPWYGPLQPVLGAIAVVLPALTLAGFVAGGAQIMREAEDPDFLPTVAEAAGVTAERIAAATRITGQTLLAYCALVLLPFAGRAIRTIVHRLNRPPQLKHASGRSMPILPGATVLEILRAYGVPHAAACGGRARCTTCRIRVLDGLSLLPAPGGLEAAALRRIGATEGVRLACQIRPAGDITVMPLLAAEAAPIDGLLRAGMEGSEHAIAVVFIDLRGSTGLGEARLPYDVMFILNQFFKEMTRALAATGGHYANFTGDGLMALYGLGDEDPAVAVTKALRGARDMLRRLDDLNSRLKHDLPAPLRMGIGIHFGEAIVGAMGPPRAQIVTAIGDTVNIAARLESLTKEHDCPLIVSRQAVMAAGLDLSHAPLHRAAVRGRVETVEFYALTAVPAPAS